LLPYLAGDDWLPAFLDSYVPNRDDLAPAGRQVPVFWASPADGDHLLALQAKTSAGQLCSWRVV
jgi:hypothetical protein